MSSSPYISFVVGTRNDNHGGNLLERMQVFIDTLLLQCQHHNLPAELVIVEWNPPASKKGLAEVLSWEHITSWCPVRIVEVPEEFHEQFEHSEKLPFHQFIAKNVGICRARGEFVVATNIDIIFSDILMRFLARKALDENAYYRSDRFDVPANIPADKPVSELLAFCRENVIRIHRRLGSRDMATGKFDRIHRPISILRAVAWSYPLGFVFFFLFCLLGKVPGRNVRFWLDRYRKEAEGNRSFLGSCWSSYNLGVAYVRRTLRIRNRFGCLHTNASGDFTMMAKRQWLALGGYMEFPGFPMHVDGLLLYKALLSGLSERKIPDKGNIYHIEHGEGSGFSEYASGEMWQRLEKKGIPRITSEQLQKYILSAAEEGKALPSNISKWGLKGENLEERTIES